MPTVSGRSRPWTDHRLAVEGMAWKYRTGAPWRDVPERFGKWNSIYKRFNRWVVDGTWEKLLSEVQKLELAQHRLAMGHRGRRIPVARRRLAGHRVRRSRRPRGQAGPLRPGRLQALLGGQLDPAAEVPRLGPRRPVPPDADRVQEPPPPQQVTRIRPQRRSRPSRRQQVPQEHRHRLHDHAIRPDHPERPNGISRGHDTARPRHHEPRQVPPLLFPRFTHADKLAPATSNMP
jgi:transposase